MNTQGGVADAPQVSIASFPRSVAGLEGSTTIRAVVCDPEETEQFPASQVDCAVFGSWVDRALESNTRIVNALDDVPMTFSVAVQAWQQLERQNHLLTKMKGVLEARKDVLDAMEGEASDV